MYINRNPYIGHDSQLAGAEEYRLIGGKGDGMRLARIWNGKGMDLTISPDRCADIARLVFKGGNLGFFSAGGYAAPQYFDGMGFGFLKNFTAGFLTTCGLNAVGTPGTDDGEELPLHGTISNTPAERFSISETDDAFLVEAKIRDEGIFARKLCMARCIRISKTENRFCIRDRIVNTGDRLEPLEILYHMNMGYPLLAPDSELLIASESVKARNARAEEGIDRWMTVEEPQEGFEEQCYYHSFSEDGLAAIYSRRLGCGLAIRFDAKQLPYFTQWKMMGVRDYVMGLEPGNCHPDGRAAMRREGALTFLKPGEEREYEVCIEILENKKAFDDLK